MLTTPPTVFKRGSKRRRRFVITKGAARLSNDDKKRAPSIVAECPVGRCGTLRTTREGTSPVESGIPVHSGINSDTETGSPVLNKRGAGSPERGRAG
ncbi:hypothetical protein GCM10009066_18030 [Halarchaeum salinum]|uniref:Cyclic nucleotide-binding domain-containing protein n=1 Tax=Halarchaeum salinum TaxID=489912 RepID=A0AAV3S7K0_9EURY